jgi:hypothetical protein
MTFLGQVLPAGSDPSTWIVGGGGVAILALLISGIIRVQRLTNKTTEAWDKPFELLEVALDERNRELNTLKDRVDVLERHIRECEYTNDLLIRTIQAGGLKVPAEVFLRRRRIGDGLD